MALYLDMCVVIRSLRQQNINKKLRIGMEEKCVRSAIVRIFAISVHHHRCW